MAQYNFKITEQKWQDNWTNSQIYKWDPTEPRHNTFVIDTPPPTVSGTLHMGPIFSYTQTDFIARFQRMNGKTVFYPLGFDDNGLPSERLVERMKNIKAVNMSRQDFIKICQDIIQTEEEKFQKLFCSMGLSIDWDEKYQTISPHCQTISQLSFIDLFEKNRVYRQMQPTYWDIIDCTALAQADLVDTELPGTMNHVIFTTTTNEKIIIATTRPELIPAAVAVFYHPNDKRYSHLENQQAVAPLFGITVPIIADDKVDMEKGTGLVMCSTFGDNTDIVWWRKHNLPLRIIISKNGIICGMEYIMNNVSTNSSLAKDYALKIIGLSIKNARSKIVSILKENNLIEGQYAIVHHVKCAERSGSPIEILVTPQWFVRLLDQKAELQEKANACSWYPSHMKNKMDQWINCLAWDWCISRQRFFGVPFPVWYSKRDSEQGKILIADENQLPIDPAIDLPNGYSREEVDAELDVMDTWATSSITPQINSHGISDNHDINYERHKKLFPADLRPQAHEIIRTWAFYTIAKAHCHENIIPWKNLMISGWCLADNKDKMSKSKGNVVSPIELIERYGADVVRYWASTAKLGNDIVYSEKTMAIGKKLITKLWNATKFVSVHLDLAKKHLLPLTVLINNKTIFEVIDLWILSKLAVAISTATNYFLKFEYHDARTAIEHFFWHDFCDNYLEIVKNRVYDVENKNPTGRISAALTLYYVLDAIIKLFAPFLPHITEELYQMFFFKDNKSVHSQNMWPVLWEQSNNDKYENLGEITVSILDVVRKMKSSKKMSPKSPIKRLVINTNGENQHPLFNDFYLIIPDLASVTNAESVIISEEQTINAITTENNLFTVSFLF